MQETDEPLAIPLWINGHAYLTMTETFFDVRNPKTGVVLRRTPLCGAEQALAAVAAARDAQLAWAASESAERAALLATVGEALESYAEHFAGLISEETGREADSAMAEVCDSVALLRCAVPGEVSGVLAIVSDESAPLLGPLSLAVPALLAGATLVLKPSAKAPASVFALAELTARSGFPAGVFNILQGDEAAVDGLCAARGVSALLFTGDPVLRSKIDALAARHGKRIAT